MRGFLVKLGAKSLARLFCVQAVLMAGVLESLATSIEISIGMHIFDMRKVLAKNLNSYCNPHFYLKYTLLYAIACVVFL